MIPSMQQAKQEIFSQEMPLSIKHSAWYLFQHQLSMTNPLTDKPFSERKALSNVLKWMRQQKERQDEASKQLTPMQKKIMRLLVEEACTQKQMAYYLGKQEKTIRHHYTQIRKKLGVASMYQAVAVAVERGWVNPPQVDE